MEESNFAPIQKLTVINTQYSTVTNGFGACLFDGVGGGRGLERNRRNKFIYIYKYALRYTTRTFSLREVFRLEIPHILFPFIRTGDFLGAIGTFADGGICTRKETTLLATYVLFVYALKK